MSPPFGHAINASGRVSEELDDLIDAADKFSRQFDLDAEDVIRGIAVTLNRRVEFDRLRKQFGVSMPKQ